MGRAFIKGILNSARGLHPQDNTPQAQQARRIQGFADLDGIEFVAKVDMEKDQNGDDKNVVKTAITAKADMWCWICSAAQAAHLLPARKPIDQPGSSSWIRSTWM